MTGKRPGSLDIARHLPVHRQHWERSILDSMDKFDITVIKSSSGQGKSTLAWQVGYHLLGKKFSVYQLNYCSSYNEAVAVSDFIESRIKLGQVPQ
ncbi:MAG: hypothetical protein IPP79_14420 [Chitinophagaceae bacterium]|nr:hypothetical protein [Chitinophagaceae bacterium]